MSADSELDDGDDLPTAPFWMATFSDMVTLLLTFFVMLVAMSEVEVKKFKEALSYFQGGKGVLTEQIVAPSVRTPTPQEFRTREQAERYEELLAYIDAHDLAGMVQVNLTEEGLHVVITDSVMFRSGEAELIEPARTVLVLLGGIVDESIQSVVVEGHTDDRPINTDRYPSNWELSTARSSSVVRFLLEQERALPAERYLAVGYGEHHPVASNGEAGGRARNRRVEILFNWKPWQNKSNLQLTRTPAGQL